MTRSVGARGAGTEMWLVRAGPRARLEECRAAFAATRLDQVLAPPGGEEQEWARAFARGSAWKSVPDLAEKASAESTAELAARAWRACEQAFSGGFECLLVVLSEEVLQLVVARALEFPLERARALRVDIGHGVLLRDDPIGVVLRHSNVSAPPQHSGTSPPGGPGRKA